MSISGGIKFFEKSKNLFAEGATILATTGSTSANFCIDRNPITYWRSTGSTDAVTEELIIEFDEIKDINRLLLVDHNWKDFNAQYDNAGTWTHFTSVFGIDGAKANITETAFADDTAYYEFTLVSTDKSRIQVTKTQTADQQ